MENLKYGDLVAIKNGKGQGLKGFVEGVNEKFNIATVWFTDSHNINGKTGVFLIENLRKI